MAEPFEMPPEMKNAFYRVMGYASEEKRIDEQFHQLVFTFLKAGGERLARHFVRTDQLVFHEEFMPVKQVSVENGTEDEPLVEEDNGDDEDDI